MPNRILGKHLAEETGSFFKLCKSYETFVELIVFLVKVLHMASSSNRWYRSYQGLFCSSSGSWSEIFPIVLWDFLAKKRSCSWSDQNMKWPIFGSEIGHVSTISLYLERRANASMSQWAYFSRHNIQQCVFLSLFPCSKRYWMLCLRSWKHCYFFHGQCHSSKDYLPRLDG